VNKTALFSTGAVFHI